MVSSDSTTSKIPKPFPFYGSKDLVMKTPPSLFSNVCNLTPALRILICLSLIQKVKGATCNTISRYAKSTFFQNGTSTFQVDATTYALSPERITSAAEFCGFKATIQTIPGNFELVQKCVCYSVGGTGTYVWKASELDLYGQNINSDDSKCMIEQLKTACIQTASSEALRTGLITAGIILGCIVGLGCCVSWENRKKSRASDAARQPLNQPPPESIHL